MVPEEDMLEALFLAQDAVKPVLDAQDEIARVVGKPKRTVVVVPPDAALVQRVHELVAGKFHAALQTVGKHDRAAAVASAFSYPGSWDRVLRRRALVLPDDVWLTSLSAQAPMAPGAGTRALATDAAANGMTIMGYTYSHAGVARLLSRLTVLPDLTSVQLQTSMLADIGKRKVVQFTILANVKQGGPAT